MGLAGLGAPVENIDALGWFFTAIGFGTWETTVPSHDPTEAALTPTKFRGSSLLHSFNGVEGVLASRGAVSLDLTGTLHHGNTSAFSPQRSGIYALRHAHCHQSAHCGVMSGILYKVLRPRCVMEEAIQAFAFFWLAGFLLVAGSTLALLSKDPRWRRSGAWGASIGLVSLLATPWTLSFSSSSAFGHLLGSLLGPGVLLAVGFYLIAFSGPVPVGRLSRADRYLGATMVVVAVVWLEGMHWWTFTPTYPESVNKYWLIFWPTFLQFTLSFASTAYVLIGIVSQGRRQERAFSLLLAVFILLLLGLSLSFDGSNVSKATFGRQLILAGADLFGLVVGAALAVLTFAVILYVYESQQVPPTVLAPPTPDQLNHASRVIAANVSGGETSEE